MKPGTPPGGLAGLTRGKKTEAAENVRAHDFQHIIISVDTGKGKWKNGNW